MDKKEIKLNRLKEIKIKYNGQIIFVKPYIEYEDALYLNKLLYENFIEYKDDYSGIVNLDYVYAIKVADLCTNVLIPKDITEIINTDLIKILPNYILNYKEVLEWIKLGISQHNIKDQNKKIAEGFNILSKSIPSVSEQTQGLKQASDIVKNMLADGSFEKIVNGEVQEKILNKPIEKKEMKKAKKSKE